MGAIWIGSSDTNDLEKCVDNTTDTLAGNETSCDSITVDVEALRVLLSPEVRGEGAHTHGRSVDGGVENERETDAHHVGMIRTHPFELASPNVVTEKDHE